MLPYKHIFVLVLLVILILISILKKVINTRLALLAILVCLVFILYGWYKNIVRLQNGETINENNECLIGFTKKKDGILFGGCLDVWHVYHLLFWALIGLLAPGKFMIFFFIFVLWEFFENCCFKFKINSDCNSFICGRVEDIIINTIGYFIGNYITTFY